MMNTYNTTVVKLNFTNNYSYLSSSEGVGINMLFCLNVSLIDIDMVNNTSFDGGALFL